MLKNPAGRPTRPRCEADGPCGAACWSSARRPGIIPHVIYSPLALPFFLLLFILLAVFVFVVEVRILAYAYRKVGVRPRYVFAVMLLSLIGSYVNIPLYRVPVVRVLPPQEDWMFGLRYEVPDSIQRRNSPTQKGSSPKILACLVRPLV